MGSKVNPGAFNCHAAALPDEPIFTILGRDPAASATLNKWADERIAQGKTTTQEDFNRVYEARLVAREMELWRAANLDPTGDGIPSWKLPRQQVDEDSDRPVAVSPAMGAPYGKADRYYACRVAGEVDDDEYAVVFETGDSPVCAVREDMVVGGTREAAFQQAQYIAKALNAYETPLIAVPLDPIYDRYDEDRLIHSTTQDVPESLTVPDDVPGHRFAHFNKGKRYAYAKGLEVSPAHLPAALDAMADSGWMLLAIFGETDSKNVGFIFERAPLSKYDFSYSIPASPIITPEMQSFLDGTPLGEIYDPQKDAAPTSATDLGRGLEP